MIVCAKQAPFLRYLGAILIVLLPAPAMAQGNPALTAALAQLQARDTWVQSIGWKIITGNALFCRDTAPAIGLLLQDVAAFSQPDAIRAEFGLKGDIAIGAVAAGSPAATAPMPPGAELLAINGQPVPAPVSSPQQSGKDSWRRLQSLHDTIDLALVQSGQVTLQWQAAGQLPVTSTLTGIPACSSRFEVITNSRKVSANGRRVAVGEDFSGFTYPEELLAAAIAHEVAHNVLGHPAWLDIHRRKQRNIRLTEREADRMMPWLLANAGYDPAAAERFMRHWGPDHDGGLLRDRSHEGWDERADAIAAELPLVKQAMAQTGSADWRRLFRRDIPQ